SRDGKDADKKILFRSYPQNMQ
ncbi:MAG: hypothetical protein FYV88_4090, partial [Bacteroidetes bacterium]|nr:hypothetical protein [Bacteroidota bacterium]